MTAGADASAASSPSPAAGEVEGGDVPRRAEGVQLLGSVAGSGYREPPALVRRGDGQVLQLTPLLYALLERVDGRTPLEGLAAGVSEATGRSVTAAQVAALVDGQLRALGLLTRPDGSPPELRRSDPLLRMRLRSTITDPARTRRITAPFAALFTPFIAVPVLLLFAVVSWWVLMHEGLGAATYDAFANPGLLLLVFVVTLASAGFHEFGHAAASTRGGAAPGRMGFGFYLVWPAFFTDVTDSYRLGRWGRLRTDLGGLYFNAIVVVVIAGVWLLTRADAVLLVVATQLVMMLRQLIPVLRFDGYHILADLVGVPDLFGRIGPTLRSLLPWRDEPEARVLKPWVRVVVTAWVLVVVPLLLLLAALLVIALPRIAATAWQAVSEQTVRAGEAWAEGSVPSALAHIAGLVAVALPLAAIAYLLVRLVRQALAWLVARLRGGAGQRVLAIALVLAVAAALAVAWWPDASRYRPIQPGERGTVLDAVTVSTGTAARTAVAPGAQGATVALWAEGREVPQEHDPALALVLLPQDDSAPVWVFPFDQPPVPRPGDNQALAVNTQDGSVRYDVAFALVWAGGDVADNINRADAYASCRDCTTVALAFQVVLVAGQADVVIPQNLATAVNYGCIECVTHALAYQLVFTVDGELTQETVRRLEELWEELARFAEGVEQIPVEELQRRLEDFRARVADVLLADPAVSPAGQQSARATATPVPSPGATTGSGDGSGGGGGATPAPSVTSSPAPAEPTTDPAPPPSPAPSEEAATPAP